MIPGDKNTAVARALQEAFGAAGFEDIRRITIGLSSDLVFRIVVKGTPFLLRIMTRIDERNDPVRICNCMKSAAEAGVAPRVLYSSPEDGIAIIDFIEAVPFPTTEALTLLPTILRRLHGLPRFPTAFNYVSAHHGFIWRLRDAGLLLQSEIEEAFDGYEQICGVYPRVDEDLVSCHMDLKPENILFDGRRVWLVDWMAASVNDRYLDLAIVANFVVTNDADERTLLQQYFGQAPDEYELARFFLMRQILHVLAASVFLLLGSAGKPVNLRQRLPSFGDFHRKIWAGEINLADNDPKIVYGLVHWKQLLENMRQARFKAALKIVAERHGCPEGMLRLLPLAR